MKKYFFGANWKMNMSYSAAINFFDIWHNKHTPTQNTQLIFFPSQYTLQALKNKFPSTLFGAQNISPFTKGAYTGETSSDLLSEDNIHYSIIGHSERRTLFNETNKDIANKLDINIKNNITSILCIGESLELRENHTFIEFLKEQLSSALKSINALDANKIIIAYEPIWAIGTGKTASISQIDEIHSWIKKALKAFGFNEQEIPVIYGGSVNASNAKEILSISNVDGALIGGASLKPDELLNIISSVSLT